MTRILWVGPVVAPDLLSQWRALSPAANRWQSSFIAALRRGGSSIEVRGHIPEPLWPRGLLRVPAHADVLPCGTSSRSVSYWNVPAARPWALRQAYLADIRPALRGGRFDLVVSYNITRASHAVGVFARAHAVPWIAIIADPPVDLRARLEHDRMAAEASGRVYLSWHSHEFGAEPRLHLDGGVDRLRTAPQQVPPRTNTKRVILYAGSVSGYAGVQRLVAAFRYCGADRELWICGKGDDPDVREAAQRDPRIRCFGFVTEAQLEELSHEADIFVNPRGNAGNQGNFPSKVLEYLTYGKPVVSTWTDGLSPDYRHMLVVAADESAQALAAALEDALSWDDERRQRYAATVAAFLRSRSWRRQAERFRGWLQSHDIVAGPAAEPTLPNPTSGVGAQG